ncbi:type I restriction endonuclease subunit R [Bathymodiolus platifrons methanotrophic gill symbiont]|uniref:type I restriction endonuclease subunit R n=1 Tax=Bathymodiolus platifrons methanotrophic gill symbiont TaxID=113268 RepID=UPI000B420B60|nr:type I restriction endonuclease subunit R [Bathymodiolus platifrons methanotrophic gill symbiont]
MTEDQLEQLCLEWFREQDYNIIYEPDISPDSIDPGRKDYSEVVLRGGLEDALQHINKELPFSAIEDAIGQIIKPQHHSLIKNNQAFHQMMIEGVSVEYEKNGEKRGDKVKLIDFNNIKENHFLAVNQYTIKGIKQPRRPDIVVFINGLPLFVVELKNPADEKADIWAAFDQIQTYKEEIDALFTFNAATIISDGTLARIGSLTADKERFMHWRTVANEKDKPLLEYELETLVKGFFNKKLLLEYLHDFILFEDDGSKIIKKIAGYHQFHGVREAVTAILTASREEGDRRGGVFWHTQGSGKSISMSCLVGQLVQHPDMKNPTIVVVTDRNDLDGQLYETFCGAKNLLKQDPVQADNRNELRELLDARPAGGIIFTTIQKFGLLKGETKHPILCDRSNLIVISDEAHRSQYGLKAKFDKENDIYKYGYAYHLREALPDATFIGFTGTPIEIDDKDTRAVFGEYVSVYDINDAVEDGATVQVYYESRLAKLELNQEEIPHIDDHIEELLEDEENEASGEKVKSEWSSLEKLVGSEKRIQLVANDLINHWESRLEILDGKAIIVCMSREICTQMYKKLTELRPELKAPLLTRKQGKGEIDYEDPNQGAIKVIMTGSASDKLHFQPHIYNKTTKKLIEKRFKDENDPLKIVIVRDMWLTGFDVPPAHTMYVDKPMKGHSLMQAITRINRVFKDKPGAVVVDYIGIASELKNSLKTYTDNKGKGKITVDTAEAFAKLLELLDVIHGMYDKFDYSDYKKNGLKLLIPAANHILSLKDGKKRYFDTVLALTKAFSLCSTMDEAKELKEEIAFLQAVKAVIAKSTNGSSKKSEEQKSNALKQILDNAVVPNGIADIFELAGLDKPDIGILSDEFLEDIKHMPEQNFAVDLLEKLLKDQIRSRVKTNIVQSKKYSDRLEATLIKYTNRSILTAQVIEELIKNAKEFREDAKRHESMGLSSDEIAFYDAIADNESSVRELKDETLKKIAVELTEKLRKSVTIDWRNKESVKATIRREVKRVLRKYKYPPDRAAKAIELVIEQAAVLSDSWTVS